MIVVLDWNHSSGFVQEPGDLTRLEVMNRGTPNASPAADLPGELGHMDDRDHAWLNIARLRELCGPQNAAWQDGFDSMIIYARSQGWIDPSGTAVRGHLVDANDT